MLIRQPYLYHGLCPLPRTQGKASTIHTPPSFDEFSGCKLNEYHSRLKVGSVKGTRNVMKTGDILPMKRYVWALSPKGSELHFLY